MMDFCLNIIKLPIILRRWMITQLTLWSTIGTISIYYSTLRRDDYKLARLQSGRYVASYRMASLTKNRVICRTLHFFFGNNFVEASPRHFF